MSKRMAKIYYGKTYRGKEKWEFLCIEMITKKDLENKYIFWNIDGTLAAYRFNGHVAD